LANCILLFSAGHETTVNLIGNGMLALLRYPDERKKLEAHPDLIESAVEEFLRYEGPVQITGRGTQQDIEIAGKLIPKGERLFTIVAAANRDPTQFSHPDRLDITRRENRHLAFGYGIHFCLGAALARLEAQSAIRTMLRRMPHLALQTDALRWRPAFTLRGLQTLSVTF
jgi:cytochrome P450